MDSQTQGSPDNAGGPDTGPDVPKDRTGGAKDSGAAANSDEVLYQGSVSLWLGWRSLAGAIGTAALGLGLLGFGSIRSDWRSVGIYVGLPLLLAGGLMFVYVLFSLRCLRYKITTRLIERERGILVKRVDSLDLGRVKDVQLVQTLMERILRIGTIELLSSDRSDPDMRIEALPKPRPVYEKLRDTVIRISQKRGIISMDR